MHFTLTVKSHKLHNSSKTHLKKKKKTVLIIYKINCVMSLTDI